MREEAFCDGLLRRGRKNENEADRFDSFRWLSSGFDTSNENPWNEDDIKRTNLAKEARMEKLKAEMEASKAGGKGGVVEEVQAKEKEVELKKLD